MSGAEVRQKSWGRRWQDHWTCDLILVFVIFFIQQGTVALQLISQCPDCRCVLRISTRLGTTKAQASAVRFYWAEAVVVGSRAAGKIPELRTNVLRLVLKLLVEELVVLPRRGGRSTPRRWLCAGG